MFLAATYLSSGSELLLEILGPGLVGGLLLPSLGALPDAMLILGMIPNMNLLFTRSFVVDLNFVDLISLGFC